MAVDPAVLRTPRRRPSAPTGRLAVYDGAEVILKPVFGTLADRVGPRPVLLGGLAAFAAASAVFVVVGNPALLVIVRFRPGTAASASSPAAGALVARLSPGGLHGRVFRSYGAFKSLGYALGPVLGAVLITVGGYPALFIALTVLAVAVTGWALLAVPTLPPLPRRRQTLLDPGLRSPRRRRGMSVGIGLAAAGLLTAALLTVPAGVVGAAVMVGAGTAMATPLAFAHLAGTAPPERLGQTMGAAEIGRELGDVGGPLLVGAIAAAVGLGGGLAALALILGGVALVNRSGKPAPAG